MLYINASLLLNLTVFAFLLGVVKGMDFEEFKETFNKTYDSSSLEAYARFCFNYNNRIIDIHNVLYNRNLRTFSLRANQFTDMRIMRFNALFPETSPSKQLFNSTPPAVPEDIPSAYEPSEAGINLTVSTQDISCNSGWAFAAAKSIELMQAYRTGNISPAALSVQNLIDCAGGSRACRNQVPQTAFDYLTQYMQDLHLENEYPHDENVKEQGMCIIPPAATIISNLSEYAYLNDGDDEALMRYVAAGYPVVVEFNPTSFEFMHYAEGVFQNPLRLQRGSHFMVVIGYGLDTRTGLNYWLLQNSFGTTWGEEGLFKVTRANTKPITKNAIFPLDSA